MGPLNSSIPIQIPPRRTASSESLNDSPSTRQTCAVLRAPPRALRPQGPFAPQPAHPAVCHGTFGAQQIFRCVVGLDYASQEQTIAAMEKRGWHMLSNNFEGPWNRLITFSRPLQAPYGAKQEICTKSVFIPYWVETADAMNKAGWSYDGMVEQSPTHYTLTFSKLVVAPPPALDLPEIRPY